VEGDLVRLVAPRTGHFDLGTGYHGDLWLDLDALFLRPAELRPHVRRLADRVREDRVDAVCGPLEGGAFLAYAIADLTGTRFLPAYRAGGSYRLPGVRGGIGGWRVAVVDDAVNAATAVRVCVERLRDAGAVPVAALALLALGPATTMVGETLRVPFYATSSVASQAWPAGQCPLCAVRVPLTDPAAADAG
jgi:orotate phosphoribosyltransferase